MIETIEWKGEVIALIVRKTYDKDGVNFVTNESSPLQLGVLKHPRGTLIKPHTHKNPEKTINAVHEVLHIEYGTVRANFFNSDGIMVNNTILNMGDTILLMSGGHGFEVLDDLKMIEVKQGPYEGVGNDKKRF